MRPITISRTIFGTAPLPITAPSSAFDISRNKPPFLFALVGPIFDLTAVMHYELVHDIKIRHDLLTYDLTDNKIFLYEIAFLFLSFLCLFLDKVH